MADKDFTNKRVEDATKIFGLIERDTKSYVILFLSVLCGVFIYLYVSAKNENISLLTDNFVKKRVESTLPQEVKRQVDPIAKGWERASEKIDTLINQSSR